MSVTEKDIRAMGARERGLLYEALREKRGLTTWELQQKIGLGHNGRSQLRQWELHGTIPENDLYRTRYYRELGIKLAE